MKATGPVILATTPNGQSHEMGAMMAAVAAAVAGWRVIYLMPSLPARDIVATVRQVEARAVALSVTYPADDTQIAIELRFLRDHLPENTAVFVGGQAAGSYLSVIEEVGAVQLSSFIEIVEALGKLGK